jgi:hypothetical protein
LMRLVTRFFCFSLLGFNSENYQRSLFGFT